MDILRRALLMLEKYPLCDHCLGRQFALLGYGMENDQRGNAIKTTLIFEAHSLAISKNRQGIKILKTLMTNGFSRTAEEILQKMGETIPDTAHVDNCFLCEDKFEASGKLVKKALQLLEGYEYNNFLVGVELPMQTAEREDEFKAAFESAYGESLRNDFGRVIGKKIAEHTGKPVDFKKPEIVVIANPFLEQMRLQVNPLFIAGRYRKIARGIPQSKWFCSECRGKGCEKCKWTGKMYPESVQEIVEKPILDATGGASTSFHASGREDIDVRMLGKGRPFVIEVARPKKRFIDLDELSKAVNAYGKNKVVVSELKLAVRETVRKLKNTESARKEYKVLVECEKPVTDEELYDLKEKLTKIFIKQRTPLRVLHRRADLTREKYIYGVDVKKLSLRKVEMKIKCQGGLYVKELVTGDEGRTTPNVSEILKNKARPAKLDVLNVIIED